jgi:hypothetical protein
LRRSEIVIGGYLVVIANCPSCGTHYKHERPVVPARGRCGRCDTTFDLSRLRPYRIVAAAAPRPEDVSRAMRHLPIGLDDPSLATTIARNVERRAAPLAPPLMYQVEAEPEPVEASYDAWASDDPLPQIPEMARLGAFDSPPPVSESDRPAERPVEDRFDLDASRSMEAPVAEGRATSFLLWLAAGAIVGTGASWTLGGTTLAGVTAGAVMGALIGWGWVRWTSPK